MICDWLGLLHHYHLKARGSLEETLEHLITAYDEKYIDIELLKKEKGQYEICLKLNKRLCPIFKKFKKRKSG